MHTKALLGIGKKGINLRDRFLLRINGIPSHIIQVFLKMKTNEEKNVRKTGSYHGSLI